MTTKLVLHDGTVLLTDAPAAELQALVDRRGPGRVGIQTDRGYVLVEIADIARVELQTSG